MEDGTVTTPDEHPEFMALLRTHFINHPPIGRYRIDPAAALHRLASGIGSFNTVDEFYLSRPSAPIKFLLDCFYDGGPLGSFRQTSQAVGSSPIPAEFRQKFQMEAA